MSTPEEERPRGMLAELLEPEGGFLRRLTGVFRFNPEVYTEVAGDSSAIPQAFVVVIGTALITGLGRPWLAGLFLGVAWAIFSWMLVAGLIWLAAAIVLGRTPDYPPLLRALGFAYAWALPAVLYGVPLVGWLFGWAAVLLCLASTTLATRQVLGVSTERAAVICAAAIATPLILLWLSSC